jgi:hypothetical protein
VGKLTNLDTASELRTMPRGSWDVPEHSTCMHLDLNIVTSTVRRPAEEQVGVKDVATNQRCIKVILSVHPIKA